MELRGNSIPDTFALAMKRLRTREVGEGTKLLTWGQTQTQRG